MYRAIICITQRVNTLDSKGEKIKRSESKEKGRKTGACAVSFDRGPLQCYQMEASE